MAVYVNPFGSYLDGFKAAAEFDMSMKESVRRQRALDLEYVLNEMEPGLDYEADRRALNNDLERLRATNAYELDQLQATNAYETSRMVNQSALDAIFNGRWTGPSASEYLRQYGLNAPVSGGTAMVVDPVTGLPVPAFGPAGGVPNPMMDYGTPFTMDQYTPPSGPVPGYVGGSKPTSATAADPNRMATSELPFGTRAAEVMDNAAGMVLNAPAAIYDFNRNVVGEVGNAISDWWNGTDTDYEWQQTRGFTFPDRRARAPVAAPTASPAATPPAALPRLTPAQIEQGYTYDSQSLNLLTPISALPPGHPALRTPEMNALPADVKADIAANPQNYFIDTRTRELRRRVAQ